MIFIPCSHVQTVPVKEWLLIDFRWKQPRNLNFSPFLELNSVAKVQHPFKQNFLHHILVMPWVYHHIGTLLKYTSIVSPSLIGTPENGHDFGKNCKKVLSATKVQGSFLRILLCHLLIVPWVYHHIGALWKYTSIVSPSVIGAPKTGHGFGKMHYHQGLNFS